MAVESGGHATLTTSERSGWRCPRCGRRFKQRTREHSCDVQDLESHLGRGGPEVRAAFRAVKRVLTRLGPHEVVPVKTMVLLRAESNFGSLAFGRRQLEVSFMLRERIAHARIHRVERLSSTRFAHHVRVTAAREVDAELAAWLGRAYLSCVGLP